MGIQKEYEEHIETDLEGDVPKAKEEPEEEAIMPSADRASTSEDVRQLETIPEIEHQDTVQPEPIMEPESQEMLVEAEAKKEPSVEKQPSETTGVYASRTPSAQVTTSKTGGFSASRTPSAQVTTSKTGGFSASRTPSAQVTTSKTGVSALRTPSAQVTTSKTGVSASRTPSAEVSTSEIGRVSRTPSVQVTPSKTGIVSASRTPSVQEQATDDLTKPKSSLSPTISASNMPKETPSNIPTSVKEIPSVRLQANEVISRESMRERNNLKAGSIQQSKEHSPPSLAQSPIYSHGSLRSTLRKSGSKIMRKRKSMTSEGGWTIDSDMKEKEKSFLFAQRRGTERPPSVVQYGSHIVGYSSFLKSGEVTDKTKVPKYMNTYRLEAKNPFKPDRVRGIIQAIFEKELENMKYDPAKCAKLCMTLSGDLRTRVKCLGFDRLKIICTVDIGEKSMQSAFSGITFLWDGARDNFATYTFENYHIFAIGTVYGVYYE